MKNVTEKLFLFLIPLLFTFPLFKESVSSGILILLILNTVLYHVAIRKFPALSWQTFILSIPFWIVVFHSLISSTLTENLTPIRHSLFFLFVPLCFSSIPLYLFDSKKINLYFIVLKNVCALIGLIYLSCFFLKYGIEALFVVFKNQNVSSFRDFVYYELKIIQIHPTYFSSILALCSIYSFDLLLKEKKYVELIYIFFFLVLSFLLLAKLNIVFLVVILVGMQFFRSELSIKRKTLLTLSLVSCVALLVVFTPGVKSRFAEVITSINKPPQGIEYNSTNIRKAIFDCSIKLVHSDYLRGVGFSNLQNKLTSCYEQNYFSHFYYENQYMTHNYFFYILISSGVFGFLFFMLYVLQIVRVAFQIRCFVFSIFLINILLMSLIEDFMYRHYGGLFFNIILLLFIRHHEHLKTAVAQK